MSRTLSAPIVTEIAKLSATPRTLYYIEIKNKSTGAISILRLTNHDSNLTFQGNTYTTYRIKHSSINTYLKNQTDNCNISIDNVDKAMSAYFATSDFSGQKAEIYKVFLDSAGAIIDGHPTTDDKILQFTGFMDRPKITESVITLRIVNAFDRSQSYTPWRRFTVKCNWDFCGEECGYNSGNGKARGTATSGTTTTLTDTVLGVFADDYWNGGILKILSGTNKGEIRKISDYDGTLKKFTVEDAFTSAIDTTSKYIVECDKSKSTCKGFSNEAEFGGFDELISSVVTTTLKDTGNLLMGSTFSDLYNQMVSGLAASIREGAVGEVQSSGNAISLLYGRAPLPGVLIDLFYTGNIPDYLNVNCIFGMCEGEISAVEKCIIDGEIHTDYSSYLGTDSQSFVFDDGETKYYRHTAVSHVRNLNAFGDVHTAMFIVKGLKLQEYDSGGSPTVAQWSQSPAWAILDFVENRALKKLDSSLIDYVSFYTAAQTCATLGYELNLRIDSQMSDTAILDLMLIACRGYFTYTSGKMELNIEEKWIGAKAHSFDDASSSKTEDNIIEGSFEYSQNDINDTPNRFVIKYIDQEIRENIALVVGFLDKSVTTIPYDDLQGSFDAPSGTIYIGDESVTYTGNDGSNLTGCSVRTNDYSSGYPLFQGTQTFPEMTAIYNDYDNQDIVKRAIEANINGKAIPAYKQAVNLATWAGRKAVEGNTMANLKGMMDSLHLTVGDVINITHDLPGWVDEEFRIIKASESEDEEVSYETEVYDASFFEDNVDIPNAVLATTLSNPFAVPGHVTGLSLSEDGYLNDDGAYVPTLALTYDLPQDNIFWSRVLVKISTDGGANYNDYGIDTSRGIGFTINATEGKFSVGETVYVKVVSISMNDVFADASTAPTISNLIDGQAVDPAIPSGLQLEGASNPMNYTWDGLRFAIKWRGASQTGGAGREPAGQEIQGAGGVGVDAYWLYDEVEIWTGDTLRHSFTTRELRYEYIYGDGYDDFLDSLVVAATGTVTLKVRRWNAYNKVSDYIEITINQQAPNPPAGLTGSAFFQSVKFNWSKNTEADFSHYQVRTSIDGGSIWSSWENVESNSYRRQVTSAELAGSATLTVDFEVKAVDIYTLESSTSSTDTSTDQVLPGDLYTSLRTDFVVRDSIFNFGDDGESPTPGTETTLYWTAGTITWVGTDYTLSASNLTTATNKYIVATLSGGTATLSLKAMTSEPLLNNDQVIIAYTSSTPNSAGNYICYVRQANSMQMEGADIRDATIQNAHIVNLTASKITAGTITSEVITLAVTPAGGDTAIKAGKTDFGDSTAGFILGIDDSDSDKAKFEIGDATNYMSWDGAALNIRGVLNADDLVAGTVTGRTLQTASSGKRFVVSQSDNEAHFYGDRGDATVEEIATIGITSGGGDQVVGYFGSSNCTRIAVFAEAKNKTALWAESTGTASMALNVNVPSGNADGVNVNIATGTGRGVDAASVSGDAVRGISSSGYGGYFSSSTSYGGYFAGGSAKAPIVLVASVSGSAPTHTAIKGSLWVTSAGILYINTDGGTTWGKVGAQ